MTKKHGRARGLALLATVASAALTLAAAPANAKVMELTRVIQIMGVDNASAADLVGQNLTFKMTYDTDLGDVTGFDPELGGNYTLANKYNEDGTVLLSSPLLSASYFLGDDEFNALTPGAGFFLMFYTFPAAGDADSRVQNYTFLDSNRDGRTFNIGLNAHLRAGETLPLDFTQPLTRTVQEFGSFSFDHGGGQVSLYFNDEGFSPDGTLTIREVGDSPGAVPEPATWALMIGGFGIAGAALRRRRVVAA